ncbi:ABC transporter substrate-binding protein [Photobacterium japonica]|uniref:ABC transporter substrate-binding protein n=1 Tax=Photobacterium japonica TaxID=2910235 RepID=UPI003D0CA6FA
MHRMRMWGTVLLLMISASPVFCQSQSQSQSLKQSQAIKSYSHEMGTVSLSAVPEKIVALDWALTETLLTLGITPYAVADANGYQHWVGSPPLPQSVIDLGSRREPNLELLAHIQPDLIIMNQSLAPAFAHFEAIAPTMVLSLYGPTKQPYQTAERITQLLGEIVQKTALSKQVISTTRTRLQEQGRRLQDAGLAHRPLLVVRFIGNKHLRVQGAGSLTGDTLAHMGLTNSWQASTNRWGFSAVGLDKIATHQQANMVYLGPMDAAQQAAFFSTPLWQAMAFHREQRAFSLPPIWTFGGLHSAARLATQMVDTLITSTLIPGTSIKDLSITGTLTAGQANHERR